MPSREFLGDEFYLLCLQDYEEMRALRKRVSNLDSRPTDEQIRSLQINKSWERFYAAILK